tara:strand:- start:538 stop:1230 length:693 start_codon:yes stop_codon:yes gene_type:complete
MKNLSNEILIKSHNNIFNLFINNKELKTPNKNKFNFDDKQTPLLIKDEIISQNNFDLKKSIYYKIFSIVKDKINVNKTIFVNNLMKYAETDLICYWEAGPEELYLLQKKKWKKIFDILKEEKLDFQYTTNIKPIQQKKDALNLLKKKIFKFSDIELSCLTITTEITGSVLLSLLFIDYKLNYDELYENCFLHNLWQSKKWGLIEEEKDRRKIDMMTFKKIFILLELIDDR